MGPKILADRIKDLHDPHRPAADRRVCLMQDPLYRTDVVCAAMGYFQVPMTSYDLATDKR